MITPTVQTTLPTGPVSYTFRLVMTQPVTDGVVQPPVGQLLLHKVISNPDGTGTTDIGSSIQIAAGDPAWETFATAVTAAVQAVVVTDKL